MRLTHTNFRSLLACLVSVDIDLPNSVNADGMIAGKSAHDNSPDGCLALVQHEKSPHGASRIECAVSSREHILDRNLISRSLAHALQGCAGKVLRLAALVTIGILQVAEFVGNHKGELILIVLQKTCQLIADFYGVRFGNRESVPRFCSGRRDVQGKPRHVVGLHPTRSRILYQRLRHTIRYNEELIRALLAGCRLGYKKHQAGDGCERWTHNFLRWLLGGSACHFMPSLAAGQEVA